MSSHLELLTRAHPYLLELAAIDRARKMLPGEIPDLAKEIGEAIGSGGRRKRTGYHRFSTGRTSRPRSHHQRRHSR